MQADQKSMHQLGLYETHSGLLLKEQVVGDKQNELSIVSDFLTPMLVQGRIYSADALHTQQDFCLRITLGKGDYVLIAKGNQATLKHDLQLFFSEPPADCRDWRTARTVNKGHGRLEIRELVITTELNDFLAGQWVGVARVFRLTRIIEEDGKTRREVVYGITSLSPARASAQDILALVRAHCTTRTICWQHMAIQQIILPPQAARKNLCIGFTLGCCWLEQQSRLKDGL